MQYKIVGLYIFAIVAALTTSVVPTNLGSEQQRFVLASSGISFTTFTVLKVTTTSTSTFTSITTCTTSTAILSSCTTGRRRRGLLYDEGQTRHRRAGLFYNEEVQNDDGNTFLPFEKQSSNPIVEVVNSSVDESSVVPLEIESGFSLPEGSPNRFLLSFGTSTITSLIISYSTVSLTAICSSTSGFPLCGGAGK